MTTSRLTPKTPILVVVAGVLFAVAKKRGRRARKVYIEAIEAGARPIEGVGTAIAAFVGLAPGGPVNVP